jgi:hypothetical protein
VSWHAQHYVLKHCHPLVKGTAKFLLLVIAYFLKKNHHTTPKLPLRQLEEILGVDNSTVRRNRDLLCSPAVEHELVRHVHGKKDCYEMLRMQGRLFAVDGRFDYARNVRGSHRVIRANCADRLVVEDLGTSTGSPPASDLTGRMRANCADPSDFVRLLQQVHEFLEGWAGLYARANDGAQCTIDLERDGAIVMELLQGPPRRTLDRLKAMAVLLQQIGTDGRRDSDRDWIARSDRSIRVLRHKADFLDLEVVRIGLDAPSEDADSLAEGTG